MTDSDGAVTVTGGLMPGVLSAGVVLPACHVAGLSLQTPATWQRRVDCQCRGQGWGQLPRLASGVTELWQLQLRDGRLQLPSVRTAGQRPADPETETDGCARCGRRAPLTPPCQRSVTNVDLVRSASFTPPRRASFTLPC